MVLQSDQKTRRGAGSKLDQELIGWNIELAP